MHLITFSDWKLQRFIDWFSATKCTNCRKTSDHMSSSHATLIHPFLYDTLDISSRSHALQVTTHFITFSHFLFSSIVEILTATWTKICPPEILTEPAGTLRLWPGGRRPQPLRRYRRINQSPTAPGTLRCSPCLVMWSLPRTFLLRRPPWPEGRFDQIIFWK